MRLIREEDAVVHKFVFDGDGKYEMDPITIIIDEGTKTCTVTNNLNTTYAHTWVGYSHGNDTFLEFFKLADYDWDYFCRKLGLGPSMLDLGKSKKTALSYFFRYINPETNRNRELKSEIIREINAIYTADARDFEDEAHSILDHHASDLWECSFSRMEWGGVERNMRDALRMLAKHLKGEDTAQIGG